MRSLHTKYRMLPGLPDHYSRSSGTRTQDTRLMRHSALPTELTILDPASSAKEGQTDYEQIPARSPSISQLACQFETAA